jgi:hypothetical protein
MFFAFSLIIEGTTVKVLKFKMPFKSIYNQNLDQVLSVLGLQLEGELVPDGDGRGGPALVLHQKSML